MKKKICVKCGRKIFGNEDYIQIIEYSGGEKRRETFYHKICFDEAMKPKRMAAALVGQTARILNKMEQKFV